MSFTHVKINYRKFIYSIRNNLYSQELIMCQDELKKDLIWKFHYLKLQFILFYFFASMIIENEKMFNEGKLRSKKVPLLLFGK
jgi:hypothetical protein